MSESAGPLPHDEYFERAVVGGIMHDNSELAVAVSIIAAHDFYSERNRILFRAETELQARGAPINLLTLRDWLEQKDKIKVVGGMPYVASVYANTPHGGNIAWYAHAVRKKSAERQILTGFKPLEHALTNGHSPEEKRQALADFRELVETNIGIIDGTRTKDVTYEVASEVLGREIPKIPPIIEGLLWPGDIALFSGAGGIGKTWLLQDLAIALASGRDAFGHLNVRAPVRVAFLDLESRGWEIDERINRLAGAAGLANLLLIRERLRLDRPEDERRIRALIESQKVAFWAVDSLRRSISGDLNKAEVANALFVNVLDPIRVETGCGFLLTAHTRKRTGELDLDAPDQAMSGTVDLRNMSDLHVGIEARDGNICVMPTKTRHGHLPEPFLVSLDGLSGDDDGPVSVRYVGSVDKASDKVQDAVVALLDDAGALGMLRGEIIGRAGYSARAVDGAIAALKRRDKITTRKDGKQTRCFLKSSLRLHDCKTLAFGPEGA